MHGTAHPARADLAHGLATAVTAAAAFSALAVLLGLFAVTRPVGARTGPGGA
ncbi:hypothetical protein ACFQ2M_36270 [Kitasatospora saccharophila]|uniref:hypothetical protein n=1 Tax=Kitasatospora saccharophila TaxID=407973 RepID=UPI0036424CE3